MHQWTPVYWNFGSSRILKELLVKVEIGGLRGKVLTMGVQKIYQQFTEFYELFGKRWVERKIVQKMIRK